MMNITKPCTLGSRTLHELYQVYTDATNKAGEHFIKLIYDKYKIKLDSLSIGLNGDSSVIQGGVEEPVYTMFLLAEDESKSKVVRLIIGSDVCNIINNPMEFTLKPDSDCVKDYRNAQDLGKRFNETCNMYQTQSQYMVF